MAYIRNSFLRMYPWRRSDAAQVSAAVDGENHQFDYWFGWLTPETFYLPPLVQPDLANPVDTNAADYASNPSGGITTLQVRMFDKLYADLTNKHATTQGWLRRRNVAYSLGPDEPGVTGENLFRRGWAVWSPTTVAGCIYIARVADDGSGFESEPINLCDLWPQHQSYLTGYKANLAACWDMAAKPVLAWESAIDTISILRLEEGYQTFEGYSPLLQCNAALVEIGQRFTNTDTILWYLKDDGGYTGTWNYNALYGPSVADNGVRQVPDTRRSSKLYFRIQRENFEIEHVMCDIPFPVQALDHVFYDGRLWDENYNDGIYADGSIIRDPDTHPTKWRLSLSLVDGSGNRSILESRAYFVESPYVLRSASDSVALESSIVDGSLFDVVVTPVPEHQPAPDTMTLSPSVTGELFDTIVSSTTLDTVTLTPTVSGTCATTVTGVNYATDTTTLTPSVTGELKNMVISSGPNADPTTLSVSISGSLVTV